MRQVWGDGEQPRGSELAVMTAVTKADLAPLDRSAQRPLDGIVGGLHTGFIQEAEQAQNVFGESIGQVGHLAVIPIPIAQRQGAELAQDALGPLDQLRAVDLPPPKLPPQTKQA